MSTLNRRRTIMDNRPTIVWNQKIERGVDIEFDITNSGTSKLYTAVSSNNLVFNSDDYVKSHKYCMHNKVVLTEDSNSWGSFYFVPLQTGGWIFNRNTMTLPTNAVDTIRKANLYTYGVPPGYHVKGAISFNIFDLTQMFGEGNEPTSVEQFEQWFTDNIGSLDTYYPYNAGQEIKVKYLPKDM